MYVKLDLESDVPIYEQLKDQIIIGIAKAELLPGERLPSVRSLASDIGINLHTVNKAYQQLKQENFLLIHRQRGVVVNPDVIPKADAVYKARLDTILRPLIAESSARGMTEADFQAITKSIFTNFSDRGENNE